MAERTKADWAKLKSVTTPKFRVSFPAVFEPKAFEDQKPKFQIVCLFDQNTDLTELKKAVYYAKLEKFGSKEKFPKKLTDPFMDGNEKPELDGYTDTIYIRPKSDRKPGIVDRKRQPIEDETEFYAGCYARAHLTAYFYDKNGNKGIAFALNHVQKLADGEEFGSRVAIDSAFDALEDEEGAEAGGGEDDWA